VSAPPSLHPAPAFGAIARLLQGAVGLVLGTIVGSIVFGVGVGLVAEVSGMRHDPVTGLRFGCVTGAIAAVLAAFVDSRGWQAPSRAPRHPREGNHGWADTAFRSALGLVCGIFTGGMLAGTAIAWLLVCGYEPRPSELGRGFELWFLTVVSMLGGAFVGAAWFAADLPVLPGRRRARRPPTGS
jgi:hypothetical protein